MISLALMRIEFCTYYYHWHSLEKIVDERKGNGAWQYDFIIFDYTVLFILALVNKWGLNFNIEQIFSIHKRKAPRFQRDTEFYNSRKRGSSFLTGQILDLSKICDSHYLFMLAQLYKRAKARFRVIDVVTCHKINPRPQAVWLGDSCWNTTL